jgi:NADH:ubiquinone oxidoreductase subunit 5 (subunit L)/multisubunit Na+/H+ antiporter MnhA subunit
LPWLTWAGVAFVTAALVRAGQFPFFGWLTEAAEGPPAAAVLLQTVAGVASGVFLLARVYPILTLDARLVLAVLGCVSLALAALVACAQDDFRKIIAWTTVSQLGYVLLFLGAGAYKAGLLHLFTHAFFKAGLLLAVGAVVEALGGQTDLRHLAGGLWRRLPITAAAALVPALALAGTPWLAGAYSGNVGLTCVYQYAAALVPAAGPGDGAAGAGPAVAGLLPPAAMWLFWVPVATTYVLAFAVGRWWWLLFIQPRKGTAGGAKVTAKGAGAEGTADGAGVYDHVHESALRTLPLILVLGFSVGPWFEFFGILQFIDKSLPRAAAPFVLVPNDGTLRGVAQLTALAPAGLAAALLLYFMGYSLPDRIRRLPVVNLVHLYLKEGFYLEPFFAGVAGGGVLWLSRLVAAVDRYLLGVGYRLLAFGVEAAAHGIARVDAALDRPARRMALYLVPLSRKLLPKSPEAGGGPRGEEG